jgi:hypothetical protein
VPYRSLREMTGATDRDREDRQSKQQQDFRRVLRDVARDDFSPAQPVITCACAASMIKYEAAPPKCPRLRCPACACAASLVSPITA